jgi:hypothetical protein
LEENLGVTINFLRRTTTSVVALKPQVIVISNLEKEFEILSRLVVEEQL